MYKDTSHLGVSFSFYQVLGKNSCFHHRIQVSALI